MTPERLLKHLEACGFSVRRDGDNLAISPAERLTDAIRTMIRDQKSTLLALLGAKPFVGWCRSPKCRWQAVTRGESQDDAWRRLLVYEPPTNHTEKIVLEAGKHPNDL